MGLIADLEVGPGGKRRVTGAWPRKVGLLPKLLPSLYFTLSAVL